MGTNPIPHEYHVSDCISQDDASTLAPGKDVNNVPENLDGDSEQPCFFSAHNYDGMLIETPGKRTFVCDINGDRIMDAVIVPKGIERRIEGFAEDKEDNYIKLPSRRMTVLVSQGGRKPREVRIRTPRLSYLDSKPTVDEYVRTTLDVKMASRDKELKYYDRNGRKVTVGTEFRDARTNRPMRVITLTNGAVIAESSGEGTEKDFARLVFVSVYGKPTATYEISAFTAGGVNRAREPGIVTIQPGPPHTLGMR